MEEKHGTLIAAGIAKRFGAFVAVDQVDFMLKEDEAVGIVGPNGAGKTSLLNFVSRFGPRMSLLVVENVEARLTDCWNAVRGVSFSVSQTEILALVGANGAGKTTLLRTIAGTQKARVLAGAYRPSAGTVVLVAPTLPRWMPPSAAVLALLDLTKSLKPFIGMNVFENVFVAAAAGDGQGRSGRLPRQSSQTAADLIKQKDFRSRREGASQLGYGGLVSVGHQAFFGVGAYAAIRLVLLGR